MTQTLGSRIKQLRIDRGESVLALAEYLATSMKVVYNIESDKSEPNLELLAKLKLHYKTTYEYLIEGSKNE